MLRSLFFICAYLAIFGLGFEAPFILMLGYEWLDITRPTEIIYGMLDGIPFSLIMGGAAVGSYLLMDRRDPPRISAITVLAVAFAIWVTLTTLWAVIGDDAWVKWNYAFKSILVSVFIPLVIRSRNHIEAFIQVFIFSLAINTIPFGAKTLVTGGSYGHLLGITSKGDLLGEGATLATVSLMSVPLILFLVRHGRIFPRNNWTAFGYIGLIGLAFLTAIGTHERTALVGMVILGAALLMKSKRKILFGLLCVAIGAIIIYAAPDSWTERMSTISANPQDPSAQTRLLVWEWTYNYVLAHPLGGGFDMYKINVLVHPFSADGTRLIERSRAFHSIYFEVLGEHGWIGLGLYLGIIFCVFRSLRYATRRARGQPNLLWVADMSNALQCSLLVFLFCGAFIGVAFQPFSYDLFAVAFSLREYVRRIEHASVTVTTPNFPNLAAARS